MIYADHAATTALCPAAFETMKPWFQDQYGNPSALYRLAHEPRKAVDHAREMIAVAIGALPEEIFFTSGGTEANNWAIKGTAFQNLGKKCEIVTSSIEHHAVLNPCAFLTRRGYTIDYLPVNHEGVVYPATLVDIFAAPPTLVSVMLANNEIGSIQPIKQLADIAHQFGSLIHTDAVQAVGHIPIDVNDLGVDMLSASAHKFNGPKGVGFLFVRKGVELEPLMHGGAQEKQMRAGTENVAGIVGMAVALEEHVQNLDAEMAYLNDLRSVFVEALHNSGLDFRLNGAEERIPGSISVSFKGVEGEMLMNRLDLMGTAVSTGSACDSMNTVLSHVLRAIRIPAEYAYGTIRITLGMDNTREQMLNIVHQLKDIFEKTREFKTLNDRWREKNGV